MFEIDYHDYTDTPNKDQSVRDFIQKDANKIFDLENGPLFRAALIQVDIDEYVFYYNLHHIISDGWSLEVLSKDVFNYYEFYQSGKISKPEPLQIQYKDYSAWQINLLTDTVFENDRRYWLSHLSGELPLLNLPVTKQRPVLKTHSGYSLSTWLSAELTQQLKDHAQANGGSVFISLLAIWNVLLYRYTNQNDIIVGSPIAGRNHADLEDQIGFYVNMLALRNQIDPQMNFAVFYDQVKTNTMEGYSHQMYPFDRLVEELDLKRYTSRSAVFDVMLTLQNNGETLFDIDLPQQAFEQITDKGWDISKFDLDVTFQEVGGYLSFNMVYNPDVYEKEMMKRLMLHFKSLLRAILENPQEKIIALDFLNEEEKQLQLTHFNSTQVDYPEENTIVDLFEKQVEKTPNKMALEFENESLTYREVNEKANQLGHYLKMNYDIQPDTLVSIKLDRSEWLIISILAVLKSGGAYVTIDPDYPERRIEFIEQDSNAVVCLDKTELGVFESKKATYSKITPVSSQITEHDLAYVIYTSGSTGKPKGVMVEHKNLVSSTRARIKAYTQYEKFLLLSSTSFDSSIAGIFGTILSGGCLVLVPSQKAKDLNYIAKVIESKQIKELLTVPSLYRLIIEKLETMHNVLKVAIVAGEECHTDLVKMHLNAKYMNSCTLYNEYGPTECTVWSTYYKYDSIDFPTSTIGRPIENMEILIANAQNQLQPVGVVGEILIGGAGVARGYLNQSELTLEKFIRNPFNQDERLYKTGDLGMWHPNGDLIFLGRKDDQLKIRGYRIELAEIEQALLNYNEIEQAVVLAKTGSDSTKLVAYMVTNSDQPVDQLKAVLRQEIPEYMIPEYYIKLQEFPLTANGKIDKKALYNIEVEIPANEVEYVAPRNEMEEKIAAIWRELLQKEKVGVYDDFFDLGGHSLKAMKLLMDYKKHFNIQLTFQDIFKEKQLFMHADLLDIQNWVNNEPDKEILKEEKSETFKF